MQNMQQPRHAFKRQIGKGAKLLALLQPATHFPDFFSDLQISFSFLLGDPAGCFREALHVFVEAQFEDGFLHEGAFEGKILLVADILADEFGEFGLVGVHVLVLFLHLKISVNF